MRYLVAGLLVVAALAGCDDPVEPREEEQGPYEVTTLQEGVDSAIFGDLNENGQALWHEGEQAVLWDNGALLEVPVGKFLGSSGEVVGDSSVWIEGELTDLPGYTRGILEDGTVYFSSNATMFAWRDGTAEATELPRGLVGPEGRVWLVQQGGLAAREPASCYYWFNGTSTTIAVGDECDVLMAEEGGWAIIVGSGLVDVRGWDNKVVAPAMYQILGSDGNALELAHVNSEGHAVATVGIVGEPDGTRVDLRDYFPFPRIRLGAINDDGEILAQLDDRVVLLTPR